VEFLRGRVEGIKDGLDCASVHVDGQEYRGRWVFDSRFRLADFHPDPNRYHYLKMQCRGWEVETQDAGSIFDPPTPTFLDFRTPQRDMSGAGQMRFFYVLPYSDRRALVEYVACTERLLHRAEQEAAIKGYLREVLGVARYRVLSEEQGANPMTDYPFPRRAGRRIMRTGIAGGMLKPTTGFAFTRIQRDSAAIVRSLLGQGHPFGVPVCPGAYRICDSLMLHGMARHGGQMASLLATFFKYGSPRRILRFLDQRGAPL
jgi:lycopene beta-cyclase